MNIPKDIVQLCGKYMFQCDRDYYKKTDAPVEFYFRVSCSHSYNSTVVFLATESGDYMYDVDPELLASLKERYGRSVHVWKCGRTVLYSRDDTEEDMALWAMSDHKSVAHRYKSFELDALEKVVTFSKRLEGCETVDQCRTAFTEILGADMEAYREYEQCSVPYKDLRTEARKEKDQELLVKAIKALVEYSRDIAEEENNEAATHVQ